MHSYQSTQDNCRFSRVKGATSTRKNKDVVAAPDELPLQINVEEDGLGEIKTHKGKQCKVAEFTGDLLVLAVGNSRQAGGGHQLCPEALLDDGLLDVSYVLNVAADQIPSLLSGLVDGSKTVSDMPEIFGTLRCDWLEVDCPDELQVRPRLPFSSAFLPFAWQLLFVYITVS